ncbi:MAG: hypothetical protein AB2556_24555, partial [Candidatus Thiodiazotropha sp.]
MSATVKEEPLRSALENPIRRKLSVRWHNKEFLTHKAALRSILQVIHHGLVGLGHCAPEPVHIQ